MAFKQIIYFCFINLMVLSMHVHASEDLSKFQAKIYSEQYTPPMFSFPARYRFTTSPRFPVRNSQEFIVSGDEVEITKDTGWRYGDSLLIEHVYEHTYLVTNSTRNVTVSAYLRIADPNTGTHDYE